MSCLSGDVDPSGSVLKTGRNTKSIQIRTPDPERRFRVSRSRQTAKQRKSLNGLPGFRKMDRVFQFSP